MVKVTECNTYVFGTKLVCSFAKCQCALRGQIFKQIWIKYTFLVLQCAPLGQGHTTSIIAGYVS